MIKAGFAQKAVTPEPGISLGGYFHDRVSNKVRDDLYVKAAVIEAGGSRVAIVACDLLWMDKEIVDSARVAIHENLGIPPEAVMISATHTHTGPEVADGEMVPIDPEWVATLAPAIIGAVEEAAGQMFEAQLRPNIGWEDESSFNRLLRMRDGTERFCWAGDPAQVADVAGPIDPEVAILGVYDREDNLRGLLVNFALHVDVIGGGSADFISADWPGELARTVAAVYGEDVVTVFLQGACGDINHCAHHHTELPTGGAPKAIQLGRTIGAAAINAVEKAEPTHDETLHGMIEVLQIPYYVVEDKLREEVAQLKERGPEGDFERFLIERVGSWPYDGKNADVPVQVLRIGPLAVVGLSGEIFVRWGLTIKAWSPAVYTMVVELANDSFGYVPTIEQAERGGYGAKPILSRRLHASAGRVMSDAAFVMLNRLWGPDEVPCTDVSTRLEAAMKPYRS